MKGTPQFRVFLALTGLLVLASLGWGWMRWQGQAPERAAWASIQRDLVSQSARIDSLKAGLARMDGELNRAKRELASASERLGHWERQAVGGRLRRRNTVSTCATSTATTPRWRRTTSA